MPVEPSRCQRISEDAVLSAASDPDLHYDAGDMSDGTDVECEEVFHWPPSLVRSSSGAVGPRPIHSTVLQQPQQHTTSDATRSTIPTTRPQVVMGLRPVSHCSHNPIQPMSSLDQKSRLRSFLGSEVPAFPQASFSHECKGTPLPDSALSSQQAASQVSLFSPVVNVSCLRRPDQEGTSSDRCCP